MNTIIQHDEDDARESKTETPTKRPFWQTEPCPPWCTETHTDKSFYGDRSHGVTPGYPMDLSLYRAQFDADTTGPATIDASIAQHYRESEPTISLTVPKHDGKRNASGETDVEMTLAEARALRDRLSLILAMVDGMPLDIELSPMTDGASRQSAENVINLGAPFEPGDFVRVHLTQWTERDSPSELEVTIDADITVCGCTPVQARAAAAKLREAADAVDRLAQVAEKSNSQLGAAE